MTKAAEKNRPARAPNSVIGNVFGNTGWLGAKRPRNDPSVRRRRIRDITRQRRLIFRRQAGELVLQNLGVALQFLQLRRIGVRGADRAFLLLQHGGQIRDLGRGDAGVALESARGLSTAARICVSMSDNCASSSLMRG